MPTGGETDTPAAVTETRMRLTWADLAAGRAAALHGHSVEIEGFLCPFTAAPAHRYFALAPEAPCCVGCLPGEPSLRIEVFADAPITTGGSVRLTGTWHALVVGIDHVGLGSDMQGLVGPSVFPSYTVLPDLAAALLAHGFAAAEVRKLLGENYVRVFRASLA
jgi:hypothetical protein